ncbi:hypothetical protein [Fusobacterium sp. PH5-44]|uniref:hypothetical protein n=1 Tax=unclassified Fusobacterium TaxID=2648384 RepID=UPI003D19658E
MEKQERQIFQAGLKVTPLPGEKGKEFADRLCRGKYGSGNFPTDAGTEHNKIKKSWRSYKD